MRGVVIAVLVSLFSLNLVIALASDTAWISVSAVFAMIACSIAASKAAKQ